METQSPSTGPHVPVYGDVFSQDNDWGNLFELMATFENNDDARDITEAWPESFERDDAYIDHLDDPQAHAMSLPDLLDHIRRIHRLLSAVQETFNCCLEFYSSIGYAVGHHRSLLRHWLHHDSSHSPDTFNTCVHCGNTFGSIYASAPGSVDHNKELGRRLKRLYIRKVLRKTLRNKCGMLRELLSTANGSDQVSSRRLSTLVENPVHVWRSGLKAINIVLGNVVPESTEDVISLILMADSMRTIPHLGLDDLWRLNRFKNDVARWKQTITSGDIPVFDLFAFLMYGLQIDGYTPSPLPDNQLQVLRDFLQGIISQIDVPDQSDTAIPIIPGCQNQADGLTTPTSSRLPPHFVRWDPGDSDLNFDCNIERPSFQPVSLSTAAIIGSVIFGVVLACLLAWQSCGPIANTLKPAWEEYSGHDEESTSILRNGFIVHLLRPGPASTIDGIDLHHSVSSRHSLSPQGHDYGLSYVSSSPPTLPTASSQASLLSPQPERTSTLSSRSNSATSTAQKRRPGSTALDSETLIPSKRRRKSPGSRRCEGCNTDFASVSNARRHKNTVKCSGRSETPLSSLGWRVHNGW
ncbi:hypothetical protein FALBO_6918 [Fusarium albosuccineum]|uniref:Uncharacterized protein n=1 Tax=Fusarium albosuccineum TaxID=1237068 RepID=A0A8H4LDP1_9HYPO|nr:hypothetical protein FALBO_6918 [Fusarium albosuccineum]